MYLLIEDPEWLQLRQEEILAIENYNRDEALLLVFSNATNAAHADLRWYVKRFGESIFHLEDVRRQMAHLHQTYSAKVEVYKAIHARRKRRPLR